MHGRHAHILTPQTLSAAQSRNSTTEDVRYATTISKIEDRLLLDHHQLRWEVNFALSTHRMSSQQRLHGLGCELATAVGSLCCAPLSVVKAEEELQA